MKYKSSYRNYRLVTVKNKQKLGVINSGQVMFLLQPVQCSLVLRRGKTSSIFAATNSPLLVHSLHINGGRETGVILVWLRTNFSFAPLDKHQLSGPGAHLSPILYPP